MIQRRFDGSTNFYRNWEEYKLGFGDVRREYYLGNKYIHMLTNTSSILRIDLRKFSNANAYAQFDRFSIGGEYQSYRLDVSGYSGTAGDSMTQHNGMKFSTFDSDNDLGSSRSCASIYVGAWWYNNCYSSNLNGAYCQTASMCKDYYGIHLRCV